MLVVQRAITHFTEAGGRRRRMRFLVQIRVFETISGKEEDRISRDILGPHIQRILEGSKVREAGFLADQRGGFFLMDVDEPEEIYETLGPEIYGQCHVKVSPVVAPEKVGPLFEAWAQEGR
jgi:hypothetical protein